MRQRLLYAISIMSLLAFSSGCNTGGTSKSNKPFTKVKVMESEQFFAYDYSGGGSGVLRVYLSTKPFTAALKEEDGVLFITADEDYTNGSDRRIIETREIINFPAFQGTTDYEFTFAKSLATASKKVFYYATTEASLTKNPDYVFNYKQWKLYAQAMAIPVKFRSPVGNVKAQAEAGPTIALAPGFKHSWNRYKGSKNALGQNTNSISVAFGPLVGVGVVDVNNKTSQNKIAEEDATKNAVIPLGAHVVLGVNNLNFGVAGGWDVITGPNRTKWNYHGEFWTGIIVGIDLFE